MFLWRISNFSSLSGKGAEFSGGRWHTQGAGKRVVYLTERPAVALIEDLVNLRGNPRFFQQHFQLLKVACGDEVHAAELTPNQLSAVDPEHHAPTRAIGDAWLAAQSSALLRVPSIPSPESWNYLLNPLHRDASHLKIEWARHITYDQRLFRLTHA